MSLKRAPKWKQVGNCCNVRALPVISSYIFPLDQSLLAAASEEAKMFPSSMYGTLHSKGRGCQDNHFAAVQDDH